MASTSNSNKQEEEEQQQPCSATDDDYPLLDNQSLEELLRLWADINGLATHRVHDDSRYQQNEQFVGAPIVPNHTAFNDMATDAQNNGLINMDEEEVINVEDYLIDSAGDYYDLSSVSPLAILPPTPPQLSGDSSTCICCQVLREIVHFNGDYTEKLEIHGRVGLISHVVHETKYQVNGLPLVVEHYKIDFSTQSLEDVRQFLMHYCRERAEAGYVMVEDPLLKFYSALCAGANWDLQHITNIDDQSVQPNSTETAEVVDQYLSQQVPEESGTRLFKSTLAMQRERTGRLKLSDLEAYFHLPIEVAAKKLAICPTVLKKICRKYGMPRWPHRKEQIKSVDRQILSLKVSLRGKKGEENALVRAKIETLKQEREQILNGMMAK
ncbi:hypothetical protein Scep_007931 [Stephania cephalantha]|uniref:RWP-RK domain-containing protein n=1 Tax=Stephania cephalantha TaxID=152367 RepID=A0AAP0KCH5_9MAGN